MRWCLAIALSVSILGLVYAADGDVRDLMTKLSDKDTAVRRAAAKDLAEMAGDAKLAAPALRKAVAHDKDLWVRRFGIQALAKIGETKDVKETVSTLALATRDPETEVQLAAADALSRMGGVATDALMVILKDPTRDPQVRKRAAQGLGKIGPSARGAVPALSDLLTMKVKMDKAKKNLNDDDIRTDAAVALGKLAKKEDTNAIEALKSVSEGKQRNKALQKVAQQALREITGVNPKKKK